VDTGSHSYYLKRNPNAVSKKGLKTTLVGIVISALLALIKGMGGFFGHSYALIADAIESGADVVTSGLLWFGLRWSTKPPDKSHPYGHGKVEALVALGISLALVGAAYVITKNSVLHIMEPHRAPAPYTLIILVIVVLTKELLYRYVLRTGEAINSDAVKADAFHHRSDAITSVAAFIGITIALVGGDGYEVADDYAALLAAAFVVYNAYTIARGAIGELLDEAINPELAQKIIELAEKVPGVIRVERCHSRKMGTAYQVDMHIWVNGQHTVKKGHDIAHLTKEILFENIPQLLDVHIHIEPD